MTVAEKLAKLRNENLAYRNGSHNLRYIYTEEVDLLLDIAEAAEKFRTADSGVCIDIIYNALDALVKED